VIQVGRYTVVKNQLFTAEIAEELRRRNRRIRILCAGDDSTPYGQAVKQRIREKQLEDYLRLIGIRKDIDVLMRKSKAFILPSKYEGMPLVLIEAEASGLRCVAAETFSREVDFGIGTVAWLPETATAAEWADAIEAAVAQPKPKKQTVSDAVMKNGFDSKIFAQKLCALYERSMEHGAD
jgi:glycosyltransferase EpsF